MRLHFVGLPHTETIKEYEWCAYTMKLMHMGQICKKIGYETILYGSANDEGDFDEVVEVVTEDNRQEWFGHIDWNVSVFGGWDPQDPWWLLQNYRTINEMKERVQPGDAICIIAGRCQQLIANAFPNNVILEWAIGYEGILSNTHHCFESEIWRHFIYGRNNINDGAFFDAVIPNSFDSKDFIFRENKDDYFLFLGRLTPRKGLAIVEEIAKNHKVITAGQGDVRVPGAEHVGVIRGKVKAELLAGAKALICPTVYIEPFGGVAAEAQLSGTPIITTDFGAFTETVKHGETGFRCRNLREFLEAADAVSDLDPKNVIKWAQSKFTLDAVAPQWKRWYDQIDTLHRDGWYEL